MVLPDVGLRFAGGSGGGQILVVTRSYSGSTDSFTNCIDGCALLMLAVLLQFLKKSLEIWTSFS